MKTLFVRTLIAVLFASFVLPAGSELGAQQKPNSQVQQKDRKRLRDKSCDGTYKKKRMGKKNQKKMKKFNKQRRGRS